MARVSKKMTPVVEAVPEERTSRRKEHLPVMVMGVFLAAALGAAGYFYYQYNHTSQVAEAKEIKTLVEKIGKVVSLPQNEVPTLATVTNKDKLDSQPFFQKAENGDKILIYTDTSRAILYRPSTEKVIDMTTVNVIKDKVPEVVPQTPAAAPVAPAPETTVTPEVVAPLAETLPQAVVDAASLSATVALYNGSAKVGVTSAVETQINEQFPLLTIAAKEKAVKNDYVGNLVIDLSGKNADLAKKLADDLGGTTGTLPLSEKVPTTDILIIVGNKK